MVVSIIIITLNEVENIEETINKVRLAARFPSGKVLPIEIIVSDGGSRDGTIELAKKLADKVIIGPMQHQEEEVYATKLFLLENGYDKVSVIPSDIPFRGK